MTDQATQFPPVEVSYRLRFTWRALEDLGVPRTVEPGDIVAVMAATQWPDIVEKFVELHPGTW